MIANVLMDVVAGPARPIALILLGIFVVAVLLEGGILALMGLRPVGKAFTSSFLVNMAACGAGFVFWLILASTGLDGDFTIIVTALASIVVQGLVLAANRHNLTKTKAWVAAVAMKVGTFAMVVLAIKLMDF